MKIDLVGPARRGLAMGLNEFAGYVAVSLAALASGYLAASYALRPQPFYLGVVFAVAGLLLSVFFVRDSRGHAQTEAMQLRNTRNTSQPSFGHVFWLVSWNDRALFSASQAGLVNNLNDGMAWGLFPLYFAAAGLGVEQVGLLAAIYPGVWGLTQLGTGALSDRLGRKGMIVAGMWMQATGIVLVLLGTVSCLGRRYGSARARHRPGVSDVAGGDLGCGIPGLARVCGRCCTACGGTAATPSAALIAGVYCGSGWHAFGNREHRRRLLSAQAWWCLSACMRPCPSGAMTFGSVFTRATKQHRDPTRTAGTDERVVARVQVVVDNTVATVLAAECWRGGGSAKTTFGCAADYYDLTLTALSFNAMRGRSAPPCSNGPAKGRRLSSQWYALQQRQP